MKLSWFKSGRIPTAEAFVQNVFALNASDLTLFLACFVEFFNFLILFFKFSLDGVERFVAAALAEETAAEKNPVQQRIPRVSGQFVQVFWKITTQPMHTGPKDLAIVASGYSRYALIFRDFELLKLKNKGLGLWIQDLKTKI